MKRRVFGWLMALIPAVAICADDYAWMDGWSGRQICSGPNNTASCARALEKAASISVDRKYFYRSGKTLSVNLKKRKLMFLDEDKPGAEIQYSYVRFLPRISLHVVYVQLTEGGHYLVINDISGKKTPLIGYPLISSDGKHLLAASEDMFAGYSENGLEVLTVKSNELEKKWWLGPDWGPRRARWINSKMFEIEKVCYGQADGELVPCGKSRFIRVGDEWIENRDSSRSNSVK